MRFENLEHLDEYLEPWRRRRRLEFPAWMKVAGNNRSHLHYSSMRRISALNSCRSSCARLSANGTIAVRRVYGDFSGTAMKSWNRPVHAHALTPVHVPPRAQGKNAADMKLAIDAMDLLHQGNLQGFCIASSDSDFTSLANRIRENGLAVFGFGEEKATAPTRRRATASSTATCCFVPSSSRRRRKKCSHHPQCPQTTPIARSGQPR